MFGLIVCTLDDTCRGGPKDGLVGVAGRLGG